MVKFLLTIEGIDIYIKNSEGLTCKDVLNMMAPSIQRSIIDAF